LTHCGQLIRRQISNFDAARCQNSRLKCTALPQTFFYLRKTTSKGRAGEEERGEEEGVFLSYAVCSKIQCLDGPFAFGSYFRVRSSYKKPA